MGLLATTPLSCSYFIDFQVSQLIKAKLLIGTAPCTAYEEGKESLFLP